MANQIQLACNSIAGFRQSYEKFLKELQVKQYAGGTITGYIHKLASICLYFNKLPENLTEDDCRNYFNMLLTRTPTPGISYFKHTVYGLRCYSQMMHLPVLRVALPRLRKEKKLPVVLSQPEVRRLLDSCDGIRSKALLSLVYSCGLRVSELINLKISDIDSDRMQVHIRQGKGRKDRYLPLSEQILPDLRRYFVSYKPVIYLFNSTPGKKITTFEAGHMLRDAVLLARILKPCTLHTLRHSYATHLLEQGENILRIRDLLGHEHITTTLIYLHLVNLSEGGGAFSPLDRLPMVEPKPLP